MLDMTNPRSRGERIATKVISRYVQLGTIDVSLVEGICRSIDLLPCSIETLSDTQAVDIIGRLITTHFTASKYAQTKYDLPEPHVVKLTEFVIKGID